MVYITLVKTQWQILFHEFNVCEHNYPTVTQSRQWKVVDNLTGPSSRIPCQVTLDCLSTKPVFSKIKPLQNSFIVVWCGEVWCDAIRSCAVGCGVVRCGAGWCGAVRYEAGRCGAVRCGVVRCGVVRCDTKLCGAVQCGAVRFGSVRYDGGAVRCGVGWSGGMRY